VTLGDLIEARHMAEKTGNRSSKEHWVLLAASWIRLAADAKAKPLDRACPSVTQKRPLVSHFSGG
jgi:hypothetical protein